MDKNTKGVYQCVSVMSETTQVHMGLTTWWVSQFNSRILMQCVCTETSCSEYSSRVPYFEHFE